MQKRLVTFLVALIVFAIVVQNTCPYGYAGKTAIAAPHAHNCPLKNHQPSKPDSPDSFDGGFKNLNHHYVFTAGGGECALEFLGPVESVTSLTTYGHEDAFSSPQLRPPRFTSPFYI